MARVQRLREFVGAMTGLVQDRGNDERAILGPAHALLGRLVAEDDWLPDAFAEPDENRYRQYLLYCDPLARFSVVSFVWGPGQGTPVHDHTVWGLVGMLRGAEYSIPYAPVEGAEGLKPGARRTLAPGQIEIVSPLQGDIHEVANAQKDRPSISIHVYGGNIGEIRRHVFDARTGAAKEFISGYSSDLMPNIWGMH